MNIIHRAHSAVLQLDVFSHVSACLCPGSDRRNMLQPAVVLLFSAVPVAVSSCMPHVPFACRCISDELRCTGSETLAGSRSSGHVSRACSPAVLCEPHPAQASKTNDVCDSCALQHTSYKYRMLVVHDAPYPVVCWQSNDECMGFLRASACLCECGPVHSNLCI